MMRRILGLFLVICLVLGLTGCSADVPAQPLSPASDSGISPVDAPSVTTPGNLEPTMYAIALPIIKETVTAEDGTDLFTLSFQRPQIFLNDRALEEIIISDLQDRNSATLTDAAQIEAQAWLDYPQSDLWTEYFIDISYTPTRLDNAILSLFGNSFSYSGGPHPSLVTDSVTYDLETGSVMYLDDVLTQECTSDVLYQLVLDSLSGQEKDLYYDYADALGDRFTGELHSIQDWYFSRNGLCFHFAPYDIAPYSSGTIIAELPYHDLKGILKEKYFPMEASGATGSIYAEAFTEDCNGHFASIASVTLNDNGTDILLYPDASVTDLRIETGSRYSDSEQYISSATVFAASSMNVGDAIHLTADLCQKDTVLRLVYYADGQEYSAFITYDPTDGSIQLSNN